MSSARHPAADTPRSEKDPAASPRSSGAVRIGDRLVGPGQPVLIIAEAGVNHDGRLDNAVALIDLTAEAGADVVKFQVFRAADLVTAEAPRAAYQQERVGAGTQQSLLRRLELDDSDLATLHDRCRERGIGFLATPFSPADIARLSSLGAAALKFASTDLGNLPLLRAGVATGLPLIVSTGAATAKEIRSAVDGFCGWGAMDRLILLHCVSCYPTPLELANIAAVRTLAGLAGTPVGLSDHTTSIHTGGWAVAAGASVLEKHITLDPDAPGPDHAMSMTAAEFTEYVRLTRTAERALGTAALGMTEAEAEVRTAASRSLVALRDLPAGAILEADMLTCKRPGGGISPREFDAVLGRRTARAVRADTSLTWDMIA